MAAGGYMKLEWEYTKDGKPVVPIVPVMVLPEKRYGELIGTSENLIGILLNTGEYVDVPGNRVRRIHRPRKG